MRERDAYYDVLERTQKGALDVSGWQEWFLACLGRAFDDAQATLVRLCLRKRGSGRPPPAFLSTAVSGWWSVVCWTGEFKGKLTTSKWAKLAKCSQDTALRDIQDLVAHGILARSREGGRSTSYDLVRPSSPA